MDEILLGIGSGFIALWLAFWFICYWVLRP